MDKLLDMVPDTFKRFGTPILSFILLILVMGFPAELVQEFITYLLIASTAITGYVEYRRFRKAQEAEEKKLPVADTSRHDGSA